MENKNKTQNRREFFKEAARKTLPILGAVALLSNPVIAETIKKAATDCSSSSCTNTCKDTCETMCHVGCKGQCHGSCSGGCKNNEKN